MYDHPVPNISGTWDFTITTTENPCFGELGTFTETGSITQSGNNVTIAFEDTTLTGTLVGDQLSVEGSASDGTKFILKGTVSSDGKSMSGTLSEGPFTGTKR